MRKLTRGARAYLLQFVRVTAMSQARDAWQRAAERRRSAVVFARQNHNNFAAQYRANLAEAVEDRAYAAYQSSGDE